MCWNVKVNVLTNFCVYKCLCICIQGNRMHTFVCVHVSMYVYVCTCVYMIVRVCTCVCRHVCVFVQFEWSFVVPEHQWKILQNLDFHTQLLLEMLWKLATQELQDLGFHTHAVTVGDLWKLVSQELQGKLEHNYPVVHMYLNDQQVSRWPSRYLNEKYRPCLVMGSLVDLVTSSLQTELLIKFSKSYYTSTSWYTSLSSAG